jgi:glucokinase
MEFATGQYGCLEQYSSATAVASAAKEALAGGGGEGSTLSKVADLGDLSCKAVMDHAKEGDPLALSIIEEASFYVAVGCINLTRVFEPEVSGGTGGWETNISPPLCISYQ